MSAVIRARRGTTAQITGYAGPHYEGELAFATDTEQFYINNGSAFVLVNDGGVWGSFTGEITDQTDLVTYVNRARTSFDMQSQDGSIFTIVVTNAGELLVIPEGSTAPTIIGIPTISGTEAVWYTLLAVPASVTGSPTPERTWQWQRSSNGTDWVDIEGATSISYLLVDLDGNNYIRVKQSESNVLGTATAESASTGVIFPSQFSTTQWQNISPILWEQLTTQTWN